jgi:hypothetical protein
MQSLYLSADNEPCRQFLFLPDATVATVARSWLQETSVQPESCRQLIQHTDPGRHDPAPAATDLLF